MCDSLFLRLIHVDVTSIIIKTLTSNGLNIWTLLFLIFFFYNKKNNIFFILIIFINFKFNSYKHNKGLANSFSYIHPICILLIFVFSALLFGKKKNNTIFTILMSFVMGGFWALQEYNWGGWWNWDLIETPFFGYFCWTMVLYHKYLIYKKNKIYYCLIITSYLYIYFFNKNFINNSIHSFSKENQLIVLFIYYFKVNYLFLYFFFFNIINM